MENPETSNRGKSNLREMSDTYRSERMGEQIPKALSESTEWIQNNWGKAFAAIGVFAFGMLSGYFLRRNYSQQSALHSQE